MASGHLERMRKRPVPPVGRTGRQMSVDSAMRHVHDDVATVRLSEREGVARRANEWWRSMQQAAGRKSQKLISKEENV